MPGESEADVVDVVTNAWMIVMRFGNLIVQYMLSTLIQLGTPSGLLSTP